ncbi:MAG: translation elongation factor Ts [Burkholderiales bacterium]
MTEITAALVKELRELTGLGMMECKRALEEAGGDLKKAEDLLRVRSGAKASKAAGRIAAEGVIGAWVAPDRKLGALVEVNCETDFVAKNEDFLAFARGLAEAVARQNPTDIAALAALEIGGENIEAKRQKLVQKIGENMTIRRFARLQTDARLAQYVHGVKIGVLIDYEGDDELAKGIAMHVAFAKPQFLSKADVSPEVLARERTVQEARAKEQSKPPAIAAKMVEGALNKFAAEIALLGQPFVVNDKLTVEKALAEKKTKLRGYRFLVVGEGIDKKSSDFAAEVMAQAGAAR